MVRIRLARRGKNKKPTYRIVVTDARSPRDGRFIEIIGNYNPVQQPKVLNIDTNRARYWLSVGAQPSETVAYLLKQQGVDAKPGTPFTPGQPVAEQLTEQPVQPRVQPLIIDRPTDTTA